jgi:YggT family protein
VIIVVVRPNRKVTFMSALLITLLQICSLVLIARAIFSWIQPRPGTTVDKIKSILIRVTEPVLAPVRRLLPNMGGLDLSVLVVLLAINLILMPVAVRL